MKKANIFVPTQRVRITIVQSYEDDMVLNFDHEPELEEVLVEAWIPTNADVRCGWDIAELDDTIQDGDILYVATSKVKQG